MKKQYVCGFIVALAGLFMLLACSVAAAQTLPTWSGTYTYNQYHGSFTVVGNDPNNNPQTTIPTILVPLKLVFTGCTLGPCSFDAGTIVPNVISSPVFTSMDFKLGGVDLGNTQYIDAYMRGSFWGLVNNPNYHLLLQNPPTVQSDLTITVPQGEGCVGTKDFGYQAGEVSESWLVGQIENYLATNPTIKPNALPVFVSYDVTIAGIPSCDGSNVVLYGVHHFNGAQTFVQASYFDKPNGQSGSQALHQDVANLTHEISEWANDPFDTSQPSGCGGKMEVGDPLDIGHDYAYKLNNVTYHLQDLAFLSYFGAPPNDSVNGWVSFQNENDNKGGQNIPCGNF